MARRDFLGGQRNRFAPFRGNHPDPVIVFVFLEIRGLDDVRCPLPFRTDLRVGHFPDPEVVVHRQISLRHSGLSLCLAGRVLGASSRRDRTRDAEGEDAAKSFHRMIARFDTEIQHARLRSISNAERLHVPELGIRREWFYSSDAGAAAFQCPVHSEIRSAPLAALTHSRGHN